MTWVIVQRGSGEFRGPPEENELITEDYVATEVGRNLIDAASPGLTSVDLTTIYRDGVRKGHLVSVYDALQGAVWVGKIIGIQHQSTFVSTVRTTLTIEKYTP